MNVGLYHSINAGADFAMCRQPFIGTHPRYDF